LTGSGTDAPILADVVRPPQLSSRPSGPEVGLLPAPAPPAAPTLDGVFRDHHGFVWRSLFHLGLPRAQVDDAVQDVFLVVYRRLADYDGRTTMRNWLYGIARRVASQYRRGAERSERRLRVVRTDDDAQPRDAGEAARLEAAELVRVFLAELDEDKREVFLLAELEGMSATEVADALELNVNTVYARLRAARLRFEKAVARHEARHRREVRG
jgi:RNA polymerase sigma-70 factor, ECF subfamily